MFFCSDVTYENIFYFLNENYVTNRINFNFLFISFVYIPIMLTERTR